MRLIDTETGHLVEKDPEDFRRTERPVYAILSHTWDTEKAEQTYEELKKIQEKYRPKVQAPQSGPGGPNAGASSSLKQPEGGPPPAHSSPSQPQSNLASVNSDTPLVASSRPTKSWFTRKTARLKRLFQCCSVLPAHSAPPTPSDCPSVMTHSLPAVGCLTQSDVETLFHAFRTANDLTSPTPTPTPSHPSVPSQGERQSEQPPKSIWDDPELSPKIRDTCALARKNGYRYIWIDSCCIDKSSSSELSEAINSMYKWYSLADVCYAYLADVPPGNAWGWDFFFRTSRWFKRGWTLQELVAPINVEFLSKDWAPIGSKHTLVDLVERTTGISRGALLHVEPLSSFSVAQRLSWAARRETTRVEDVAYSLLGLFDINMPTLYGEGDRAFQRLQEQIMQRIPDQSLFAWGSVYLSDPSSNSITLKAVEYSWVQSPSADSPYDFRNCGKICNVRLPASLRHKIGYISTPYGICTQFQMIPLTPDLLSHILPSSEVELELPHDSNRWYLAILGCEHTERPGHLLGRVCYIPASPSGVEFAYAGYINFGSPVLCDLVRLSPDTIEHFRPHLELKSVYIPHPNATNQRQNLLWKPHNTIKLVLLTETCDALRSRGYSADLRDPDPDHPTTHYLTLSNDGHTITVEFQHTLENYGQVLTITAEVKMSGSGVQPDSASDSDQAALDRHTVSWGDNIFGGWQTRRLGPETVRLSAVGAETLCVDLSLDFGGKGFYYVCIDVRSDAPGPPAPTDVDSAQPASAAVESAGDTDHSALWSV